MTNLTFAIEAARRGCPFLQVPEHADPYTEIFGSYPRLKNLNVFQRFVFGATLALWWEEKAMEYPPKPESSYRQAEECWKYAADARSFAKGL